MYDGTAPKRDITAKTNQMSKRPVPCQAGARQACLGVGGEGPGQNDTKHHVGWGKIVDMKHPLWRHILHFDGDPSRWIQGPGVLAKDGRGVRRQGGRRS